MKLSHVFIYSTFLLTGFSAMLLCCSPDNQLTTMEEIQLTNDPYGHMLYSIQVFSPDDEWIAYDIRNDQTQIGRTCCIEKVNVNTGEVVRLYSAPNQTLHGPGVGAPAWHPREPKMIFIHGLLNCDEERPYGFTRRFGALLDEREPGKVIPAEARTVGIMPVAGALRGGTHAHSWSGDGDWISFTYNDYLFERLEQAPSSQVKDLRTIGVMSPVRAVQVGEDNGESFSGVFFSTVAATVTELPRPGSDEIEKAFDECWVGDNGYVRPDGARQKRAIAFQGHVKTANGSLLTEVFVADIPDDITVAGDAPLEGSLTSRPAVPRGLVQRRVTFTQDRKFPGLQGPRFWLRSSPDGSELYFLMKDDNEIVQIYAAPVNGGDTRQVTHLETSVLAQFNVSPDGRSLALIADNSIWVCDIQTGQSTRLTAHTDDANAPVAVVVWNRAGDRLVYNRFVADSTGNWLQIFALRLN